MFLFPGALSSTFQTIRPFESECHVYRYVLVRIPQKLHSYTAADPSIPSTHSQLVHSMLFFFFFW